MQHSYKETVVEPTTESEGYTLHECSACGHSFKVNFVDKLTHIWGDATGEGTINGRDLVLL